MDFFKNNFENLERFKGCSKGVQQFESIKGTKTSVRKWRFLFFCVFGLLFFFGNSSLLFAYPSYLGEVTLGAFKFELSEESAGAKKAKLVEARYDENGENTFWGREINFEGEDYQIDWEYMYRCLDTDVIKFIDDEYKVIGVKDIDANLLKETGSDAVTWAEQLGDLKEKVSSFKSVAFLWHPQGKGWEKVEKELDWSKKMSTYWEELSAQKHVDLTYACSGLTFDKIKKNRNECQNCHQYCELFVGLTKSDKLPKKWKKNQMLKK